MQNFVLHSFEIAPKYCCTFSLRQKDFVMNIDILKNLQDGNATPAHDLFAVVTLSYANELIFS